MNIEDYWNMRKKKTIKRLEKFINDENKFEVFSYIFSDYYITYAKMCIFIVVLLFAIIGFGFSTKFVFDTIYSRVFKITEERYKTRLDEFEKITSGLKSKIEKLNDTTIKAGHLIVLGKKGEFEYYRKVKND